MRKTSKMKGAGVNEITRGFLGSTNSSDEAAKGGEKMSNHKNTNCKKKEGGDRSFKPKTGRKMLEAGGRRN